MILSIQTISIEELQKHQENYSVANFLQTTQMANIQKRHSKFTFDRYNFYGTIETDQAENSFVNFKFKRQFNDQLKQLVGEFPLDLNPRLKFLKKFIHKFRS